MRPAVALTILSLAAAPAMAQEWKPAPLVAPEFKAPCLPSVQSAQQAKPDAHARPFASEPTANLYLGVMRLESGCDKPVIVRQDINDLKQR